MGSLHDQESAVADLMEVLEEHRENCEHLGKYMEADIARKRIDELKGHEEARRKEAMRARQLAEVLAVEEAHMMEFQQFNAMWDAKMQAYETNGAQLLQAMKVGFFSPLSSLPCLGLITGVPALTGPLAHFFFTTSYMHPPIPHAVPSSLCPFAGAAF